MPERSRKLSSPLASIEHHTYARREGEGKHLCVRVNAGRHTEEVRDVGTPYEHTVETWDHLVEVYVSPTGRSVRVFVDHEEVGQ